MIAAVQHQKQRRNTAAIGTVVFHVLLFILFLFVGLTQPNPPLEEESIEISMADFGTSNFGSGNNESPNPAPENAEVTPVPTTSQEQPESSEEVATQEESPVTVPTDTKPKPPKDKPAKKPKDEKPAEPTVSDKLSDALNAWNTKPSGGSGDGDDQQTGNTGTQSGDPDGQGTMHGNGWSVSLGGRGLKNGPNITDKPAEAGKVVLNIFVDRNGKVTRTTPNLSKSTTTSTTLFNIAKKAAMQCTFSVKPDAAHEQKGSMTFNFILE